MVTKAFKKELVGLSPWQLTQAVKHWMENNGARLNLSFAWSCLDELDLEVGQEDDLWLQQTDWRDVEKNSN